MEERIEDKHHTMWFEKIALKLEIENLMKRKTYFVYEISVGFQSRKSGAKD